MSTTLPIVLIGPMAAGKTTLSRALSASLALPYAPLDWVAFHTIVRDGLDVRAYEDEKVWANRIALLRPHLVAAAEAAVRDFPGFVLDFGAGHAHFTEPDELARLDAVLGPLPNVFHVVPSLDPDETVRICLERDKARWAASGQTWDPSRGPFHEAFARSESFRRVAKHTVVTGDRSVEACVEEIRGLLR